jgi:gas vesicle protein
VSERDSGIGSFVLGIAVGAVLGLLFAPEAGEGFRDELGKRLRSFRDLAMEKAEELGELVTEAAGADEPEHRIAPPRKRRRPKPRRPRLT